MEEDEALLVNDAEGNGNDDGVLREDNVDAFFFGDLEDDGDDDGTCKSGEFSDELCFDDDSSAPPPQSPPVLRDGE